MTDLHHWWDIDFLIGAIWFFGLWVALWVALKVFDAWKRRRR